MVDPAANVGLPKMRVGFIGLGLMGKPMAGHLIKAGYPLTVHNRSRAAVNELVTLGAQAAASPRAVAMNSAVVITMLPDSPDVESVINGPDGILAGARPGLIHVDMSTIAVTATRRIAALEAEHEVIHLDAPVSGGEIGAQNATLTIMAGGDEDAMRVVEPIFKVLGKRITHLGPSGCGQVAKACNQIMVAAQMVAMGELLIMAQKAGADPEKVVEAIKGGAAQCWTLDNKPQRLFAGNRAPGFKASMQLKDLNIVMEMAKAYAVPLPGTAANTQVFNALIANGLGDQDNAAVISVIEQLAHTLLKTKD
ncbi:2-hydroxy-3-oxopropionate reductase [Thermoflexales bacterium]|nr:2-hydroxy-3-oxopropionate reductase [Thermoflexales bacterium]